MKKYSIGVDYGTNSVRAVVVDIDDGKELAASVYPYPSGTDGVILSAKDPQLARQNPADYIDGFFATVTGIPVSEEINLSRPRRRAPPPVKVIPLSIISAASSGGVLSRV